MGRQHAKRRSMKISQAQKRRKKLGKLRRAYGKTDSETKKEQILEKVFKIAPWLSKEKFLEPLQKEES